MKRLLVAALVFVFAAAAGFGLWTWWQERNAPPTRLAVAAGPVGSDGYELMREVAEVVERHSDKLRLDVVASADSSGNVTLLLAEPGAARSNVDPETEARRRLYAERVAEGSGLSEAERQRLDDPTPGRMKGPGRVDLGTLHADTPAAASIQLVARLFTDYYLLIARADAGITGLRDLRGKRLALPPTGTDELRSFFALVDHYRLDPLAFSWRGVTMPEAIRLMTSRQVDAVFTVRSVRDRSVAKLIEEMTLTRAGRLVLVPIDQTEAVALKRPFLRAATIVKGAFDGETELPAVATPTPAMDRYLVARDDTDVEALRELTRVLFEHRLDLTARVPLADEIADPRSLKSGLVLPLHPGAERYYLRDEPGFFESNADVIGLYLSIGGVLVSAGLALRSRFAEAAKNRADSYNYDLLALAEKAREASDGGEVAVLRDELDDVLKRIVVALDKDEITEEGFQSFALVYQSVRERLQDRARELAPRDAG